MRAAPPVQVTLTRFRIWSVALWTLALADLACLAAWASLRPNPLPVSWVAATAAIGLAALAVALSARARPVRLRWDGQAWHLAAHDEPADAMRPGRLGISLDLGFWMLLRFAPAQGGFASAVWLPVQRRGLESQWHALRCGIFSPLPAASSDRPRAGDT
jgi:hypothetical protein